MYNNSFLDMRSSDHYRHEKEEEAANWEMTVQHKTRRKIISRNTVMVAVALIAAVVVTMSIILYAEPAAAESPAPALVPGSGSSGSDAAPGLNLLQ